MKTILRTILFLTFLHAPAMAMQDPREKLSDPALEQRAQSLFHDLRCVVCQNQTIADSNAAIAADMRAMVREQLLAGADDDSIINMLHDRYGDYVLMRPPVDGRTGLLWLMPLIGLAGGGVVLLFVLRRARTQIDRGDAP